MPVLSEGLQVWYPSESNAALKIRQMGLNAICLAVSASPSHGFGEPRLR